MEGRGQGEWEGEKHTIKHHRTTLTNHPNITSLLLQLPDCGLFCGFACVDEARGDFDDYLINGGPVLFLQDYFVAWLERLSAYSITCGGE